MKLTDLAATLAAEILWGAGRLSRDRVRRALLRLARDLDELVAMAALCVMLTGAAAGVAVWGAAWLTLVFPAAVALLVFEAAGVRFD